MTGTPHAPGGDADARDRGPRGRETVEDIEDGDAAGLDAAPVRVLLVDDQPLLRHSLAIVINGTPGLAVAGEAGNGHDALALTRRLEPDVVLMDIRMPGGDGIEATRAITRDPALSQVKILVLSMFELDEYVYAALHAGAAGFLLKDAHPDELIAAIRRTHAGEALFAPSILTRLVEHYLSTSGTRAAPRLRNLTERETEVLTLVARGLSNHEIAHALTISIKTVKTHIGNLLSKLSARDRAQLVIAAYENDLITSTPKP
ncbi:DNA-binding response regulator, NarL/FixJ family, contains REC and HTH domains [Sinosporangium album]|uniref:DNA-binding response regulator, NarL/FixJ family, contains REC and HTH domains n=1 Tax=Sinosporangium album TaxID=504805 RepID=A0A1G7WS17_9ACTN|nr:response regulator transcription factor [Sinosporangium album]SDG74686.1 DNA-binding response regulator, NarL/FixJ family, contains REC and HTH domains [Sinosporangium album]